MNDNLGKESPEASYLRDLTEKVEFLRESMDDILALSRLTNGDYLPIKDSISINSLIKGIIGLYEDRARTKALDITMESTLADDLRIISDRLCLRQILSNVIGNAVKYSDRGNIEVKITYGKNSENLLISVVDMGKGIADNELLHIFEKFYKSKRSSRQDSHGIGLYLSKLLAEKIGGYIEVNSTIGIGTEVFLGIPFERELKSPESYDLNGLKRGKLKEMGIVFIDDNEINLAFLMNTFQDYPNFLYFKGPVEAMEYLMNNNVDILITDIFMHPLSGYDVLVKVRTELSERSIKVFALSSAQDNYTNVSIGGKEFFFDGILKRPLSEVDLFNIL